ncbi:hypothetical protein IC762_03365 [Bradyrhizobium genosp. L]|uniref:hypothetical protein n=1 Tax=Bradyrhizobium genosp. L TaxID=83637 RepID=UPI0018A2AFA1|nr:hypothetical protein [Bradyrhizobium genosp. L]QPF85387.1 hypothetical protein IC762_03365 [Bradyrhizobium genosp. L]
MLEFYLSAKSWIERSAYANEIRWQERAGLNGFSESDFLREYAWVVLNSGFRESVVRKHFNFISLCYCDWQSAREICELSDVCSSTALTVFGNRRKLQAISQTAAIVHQLGFQQVKAYLDNDFFGFATSFPLIGPITVHHLAKNLGVKTAKPDRHLARLALRFGYSTVNEMCSTLSFVTGDNISVTDIVLWRFEEQHFGATLRASKRADS